MKLKGLLVSVIWTMSRFACSQTSNPHPDQILPQVATFLGTTDKLPVMRACIDLYVSSANSSGGWVATTPLLTRGKSILF